MRIDSVAIRSVLLQQVPDARILQGADAFDPFGLTPDAVVALPDVLAWSEQHNTLFCIEGTRDLDHDRLCELRAWSQSATCRMAFVSVFATRAAFAARMDRIAFGTHVWFVDTPDRSVFLSESPEASERYREARFAAMR